MDGLRDYHTKWSTSERESQTSYDITDMWNLKYDPEELILQNGNRLTDMENRPVVPKGERGGGGRDQG